MHTHKHSPAHTQTDMNIKQIPDISTNIGWEMSVLISHNINLYWFFFSVAFLCMCALSNARHIHNNGNLKQQPSGHTASSSHKCQCTFKCAEGQHSTFETIIDMF